MKRRFYPVVKYGARLALFCAFPLVLLCFLDTAHCKGNFATSLVMLCADLTNHPLTLVTVAILELAAISVVFMPAMLLVLFVDTANNKLRQYQLARYYRFQADRGRVLTTVKFEA